MNLSMQTLVILSILLPFGGALAVLLTGRWPNLREAVTLVVAGLVAVIAWSIQAAFAAGESFRLVLVEPVDGLPIALSAEPLGVLFALVAGSLWIVTSLYAIGYMRGHHEQNQTRFFAAFALAIGSAMGIAFSDNLFTLFLFYELLTVSTYPLVTHAGTPEARRGGRTYLGILLGTSIGLQLLAIIATYALTGTLDFKAGGILSGKIDPAFAGILLALFVFGVGKAAVMPFHRWLPAAMVAPTPVSALLHAVAVVKAGVFTVLKIVVYIFGIDFIREAAAAEWLIWFPAATILLASLIAITKDNLKARLAYSTISQLSYIVMGALLANQMGILGGALHITMHAFAKITLFFAAGAIMVAAHKTEISEMRGLGRAMPITFAAFFIASLSNIGLPPLGGTWSKWFLMLGTIDAGEWLLLAVLLASSLLNIFYLLPIPIRAFFSKPADGTVYTEIREAPWTCLAAMIVTSIACVWLFFNPAPFHQLAAAVAGGL